MLADVVARLRDLDSVWWTHASDEDLVGVVEQVAQLRAVAAAIEAGAVAEADSRDLGKQRLAYGSTGDWLTHLGGLRKGQGRRVVAPPRPDRTTDSHPGSHGGRPRSPDSLT